MLKSNGLPRGLTWGWLLERHNEHKIVLTKLQILLSVAVDGWNVVHIQVFNLFFYFAWILWLGFFLHEQATDLPKGVIAALLLFLGSLINCENHSWAFQSQFHFGVAFLSVGAFFLFRPGLSNTFLGSAFCVLSMFSVGFGVPGALTVFSLFGVFILLGRREQWRELVLACSMGTAALWLWLFYDAAIDNGTLILPHRLKFWRFLAGLVSLGFGFEGEGREWWDFLILFGVLGSLLLLLVRRRFRLNSKESATVALTAAYLSSAGLMAAGRAARFGVEYAKRSRYSEVTMALVPLTGLLLFQAIPRGKWRGWALGVVWAVAFLGYSNNWNFRVYNATLRGKQIGLECIQNFYTNLGTDHCATVHEEALADYLAEAKRMRLSFFRDLQNP